MKRLLIVLLAMAMGMGVAVADTVIVNGVVTESSTQLPPPSQPADKAPAMGELDEVLIDFDDLDAPGLFSEAEALTDEYTDQGVTFVGLGEVLNESGNFGISGYSPPNFLAFSNGAGVSGPETLLFDPPVGMVGIKAGHGSSGMITMQLYDVDGNPMGSTTSAGSSTLTEMVSTSDVAIGSVVLSYTGSVCCFDDLVFEEFDQGPVEFNLYHTNTVIPPTGGDVVYDVELVSSLPGTYPGLQYWTMVTLPNGQEFGPLMTVNFTMTPFMDVYVTGMTQTVPALAPTGVYYFHGYAGIPNVQFVEDTFGFEKLGTAADGVVGWGNSFPAKALQR